ncbi:MAG: hypothetical protein QM488_03325 [Rhizobiaceae bacterium]
MSVPKQFTSALRFHGKGSEELPGASCAAIMLETCFQHGAGPSVMSKTCQRNAEDTP